MNHEVHIIPGRYDLFVDLHAPYRIHPLCSYPPSLSRGKKAGMIPRGLLATLDGRVTREAAGFGNPYSGWLHVL
jgi:hypothetical protein